MVVQRASNPYIGVRFPYFAPRDHSLMVERQLAMLLVRVRFSLVAPYALVAQPGLEHAASNRIVVGSNPTRGSISRRQVCWRLHKPLKREFKSLRRNQETFGEGGGKVTVFKVFTDASSRCKTIVEHIDGGRVRKTHPSSIGAVIKDGSTVVGSISEKIGFHDSNYAEFLAMYTACRYLIDHGITKVDFYADCLNLVMMVNQKIISGQPELRKLSYAILSILEQFEFYTMTWIPRTENKEAHNMAARAFKAG